MLQSLEDRVIASELGLRMIRTLEVWLLTHAKASPKLSKTTRELVFFLLALDFRVNGRAELRRAGCQGGNAAPTTREGQLSDPSYRETPS